MEWTERLDIFEKYVGKKEKQGWTVLDYYKDQAIFQKGQVFLKAEVDYDGSILEKESKTRPR